MVGVNHHQLDWVCVLGSVKHYVSFPALRATYGVVMVILSSAYKDKMLTEVFFMLCTKYVDPTSELFFLTFWDFLTVPSLWCLFPSYCHQPSSEMQASPVRSIEN